MAKKVRPLVKAKAAKAGTATGQKILRSRRNTYIGYVNWNCTTHSAGFRWESGRHSATYAITAPTKASALRALRKTATPRRKPGCRAYYTVQRTF